MWNAPQTCQRLYSSSRMLIFETLQGEGQLLERWFCFFRFLPITRYDEGKQWSYNFVDIADGDGNKIAWYSFVDQRTEILKSNKASWRHATRWQLIFEKLVNAKELHLLPSQLPLPILNFGIDWFPAPQPFPQYLLPSAWLADFLRCRSFSLNPPYSYTSPLE